MLFTDMPDLVFNTVNSTAGAAPDFGLVFCAVAVLAAVLADDMLPLLEVDPKQDQGVLRVLIRIPCRRSDKTLWSCFGVASSRGDLKIRRTLYQL